ncbi:MAG TPA: type II toxin-antitoxin system RelE/ParE family toxin [Thermoanaerobaculia bacterium]|nr:type II toxin-antitoxin system RelE/ParE family toxin [Thermoanaerobaculia bacterium]
MMGFVLDPLAEEDLKDAARHYEEEVRGLGDDFLGRVYALIERLTIYPQSGLLQTKNVRVARVSRFPYDVYYKVEPDSIFVLAVMHQSRKPGLWKKRL